MRKLLVMTDIHMRNTGQQIIGLDPFAKLETALVHALTHHHDADRLILTGDLTHTGTPAEYARVTLLLQAVPIPVTVLPGNHDIRENFAAAFPFAPRTGGGFFQEVVDYPEVALITLDTLMSAGDPAPEQAGYLCAERLNWLDLQLHNRADKSAVIFLHHPPHKVGFGGMDNIRLANGDELLALLNRHGNVAHLFAGHVHRTISGNADGISYTMYKSTCHQMPMDLRGDDFSCSVPEPAAYGVVLLDGKNVIAHSEDFEIAVLDTGPQADALG